VNKLDSACHSNNFSKKLEFTKILKHHETGIKHIIKSPHLPCGLKDVVIFGLNFKTLFFNVFDKNR
jgi:hypothetical protein